MRQRVAVVVLALAAAAVAEPLLAIPAFQRRYKVACHFCHDGYPKLNAIGQRFKERGFRMEREDDFDADKWLRSVPVVVRAQGAHLFEEDEEGVSSAFIKGISAGNLGRRISYWVDDGIVITEGDDSVRHNEPDNAWMRFEVVTGGKLYVRAGRIELDLPFTQTRTPHLFPYEIYFENTGFESDDNGGFQDGLEIGGGLPQDVRWSAAVVKGRNADEAKELADAVGKFDANLFLRLSKRIDRSRVGAFAYIGRNTLARDVGTRARNVVEWDDNLLRIGGDASIWFRRFNVYGVFMYGRNDNSIADRANPNGTQQSLSFSGGFLQGDYHMRDQVALTLRLNVVSRPPGRTSAPKETFSSLFPGVQVWLFERLKLSFEYGFRNKDRPDVGQIQAEVAF